MAFVLKEGERQARQIGQIIVWIIMGLYGVWMDRGILKTVPNIFFLSAFSLFRLLLFWGGGEVLPFVPGLGEGGVPTSLPASQPARPM